MTLIVLLNPKFSPRLAPDLTGHTGDKKRAKKKRPSQEVLNAVDNLLREESPVFTEELKNKGKEYLTPPPILDKDHFESIDAILKMQSKLLADKLSLASLIHEMLEEEEMLLGLLLDD